MNMENPIARILFIDDDEKLCALMHDYLTPQGFALKTCTRGAEGLRAALDDNQYDLILLDLMLSDMHGLEILRQLRGQSSIPVIILSAEGSEVDRVTGLEMGADDYISKPFSPRELLARLRAVLRRMGTESPMKGPDDPDVAVLRGLRVNLNSMEAELDSKPLNLSAFEFRLLAEMIRRPGRVFSREHLMDCVAERDLGVFDRSIDMHISTIRRKLGDNPRYPQYLKTIRGAGYTLLKQPSHIPDEE